MLFYAALITLKKVLRSRSQPFGIDSLRDELQAITQARIMRGLAALLDRGEDDVTFEALAKAANVPQRTIYRYHANKDALFASFWTWLNDEMEVPSPPETAEELIDYVRLLFAAFDRREPLVRAILHHPQGRAVRLAQAEARQAKFRGALKQILEHRNTSEELQLLATVTALCSASGWESIKDNWRLQPDEAAAAAQWAACPHRSIGCRRTNHGRKFPVIHHMSFNVGNPQHVANVLTELTAAKAVLAPSPPFPHGSWFVCFGDQNGSLLELLPKSVVFDPEAPLGVKRSDVPLPIRTGSHVLIGTPHSYEVVIAIAEREGWRTQQIDTGFFEIVKVWVEDTFLIEFLAEEKAHRYTETFNGAGLATVDQKLRGLESAMKPALAGKFSEEQVAAMLGPWPE